MPFSPFSFFFFFWQEFDGGRTADLYYSVNIKENSVGFFFYEKSVSNPDIKKQKMVPTEMFSEDGMGWRN